jgi:hypothetical protein
MAPLRIGSMRRRLALALTCLAPAVAACTMSSGGGGAPPVGSTTNPTTPPPAPEATTDGGAPDGTPAVQPDGSDFGLPIDDGGPDPNANALIVYRMYDPTAGDHLLTATRGEGAPTYQDQGPQFVIQRTTLAGTAAIYRCHASDGHHFLSTSSTCEGNTAEALLGYVYTSQVAGSLPLYRCVNTAVLDWVTTVNLKDCSGYVFQGGQGYAMPATGT